jgi:hypothetical protein
MPRKYMPEHIPANYLLHMNAFIQSMATDERLKPAHVSLYITLFGCWNKHFFVNPFPVYRRHIMTASHIGSRDTYIKTLKELHTFGYVRYYPSDLLAGAAQVAMLPLPKKGLYTGPESGPAPGPETGPYKPVSGPVTGPKTGRNNKQVNNSNKKNSALPTHLRNKSGPQKPSGLPEVTTFFKAMHFSEQQAPLFFSHYEANGWRQSNGLLIRNWQAAAEKWVLNAPNFKNQAHGNTTGRLHTGKPRYSDPL